MAFMLRVYTGEETRKMQDGVRGRDLLAVGGSDHL
jgi:hypothetical protein